MELKIDPANLLGKELTPLDTELAFLFIDIFYLLCIQKEYGSTKNYIYEYGASIRNINYSSPFSAVTFFKNISVSTAKRLFEMITYYPQEKEKRELANTEKKLDLLEKARALRNRLIKDGIPSDEATKLIMQILSNQNATLLISGPEKDI